AAEAADVHGVPGTTEFLTSGDEVVAFGNEHGWPVAIKAAFGGGGRGMRVVESAEDAHTALASAQSEALKGFGRDECYVERFLVKPRHVEMQIIGDQHGNCVWIGERDCSVQRRHQKLIEEAPAPNFPDEVRQAMGEAAVRVAKACGYYNAGTVEFLYDDGNFYFLEMNTRLQVEHPVTELVSGIDLVREQIRVASGETLSFTQDDIDNRGWAMEVRVNAENPAGGKFLPAPGKIEKLVAPQGFGTRWDGGYETGDEVSQFYDNLVGKLIVWGSDRDTAIDRLKRAINEMVLEGIDTTLPAQLVILDNSDFRAGEHSTNWVDKGMIDLTGITSGRLGGAEPEDEGEDAEPKVRRDVDVEVNGKRFAVAMWVPESAMAAAPAAGGGAAAKARPRRAAGASGGGGAGTGSITAPMQGTIFKVEVAVGDEVAAGQVVAVLEAMKMENNVATDVAGTVAEVKVEPGQAVGSGDVLVVVTPAPAAE
ncbi:MAG TPA: biotin/lipoyl-containing protein, partial [Acidimicrobiales bacterium]|nr:biotin/lipoyl-containing protein [Acidimicrobiales bacterium]